MLTLAVSGLQARISAAVDKGQYEQAVNVLRLLPPTRDVDSMSIDFWVAVFTKLHLRAQQEPLVEPMRKFIKGLYGRYQNVRRIDSRFGSNILFDLVRQPEKTRINDVITDAIASGVNMNLQNCFGATAAISATMRGNYVALEILTKHKCDLTLTDHKGKNVLHWLCQTFGGLRTNCYARDSPLIRRLLTLILSRGVDIDAATTEGETALMIAACQRGVNCPLLFELLSRQPDVNRTSPFLCEARERYPGMTALHLYLCHNPAADQDPNVLQRFLECGFDPDLKDSCGRTALVFAVQGNSKAAIRFLLLVNSDVNISYFQDVGPRDLMMDALLSGDMQVARFLLDAGYSQNSLQRHVDALRLVEEQYKSGGENGNLRGRLTNLEPWLRPYDAIFVRLPDHYYHCLERYAFNPILLSQTCRTHIRKTLGRNCDIGVSVQKLGLPTRIQQFVLLEDILHD